MTRNQRWLLGTGTAGVGLAALLLVPGQLALTADHLDPPARTDPTVDPTPDAPADIADIYAWHDANFVYLADTFGGPAATNLAAAYDRDVLHTINISTAAPATSAEIAIRFRFGPGQNPGEWGIKVENVPGVAGPIVAPVEQVFTTPDGVRLFAGLRDDPFFFDSQGLRESRNTGTIQFKRDRSFFDGKNITFVILAIPRERFAGSTMPLNIWATSGRFGGQI